MDDPPLKMRIIGAWEAVAQEIALGGAAEFSGRSKETLVFRRLRKEIERAAPCVRVKGPDDQERFCIWSIDIVCRNGPDIIAVEGKYKIDRDGAVPDNRKAVFFDLYKLEQYVDSGLYTDGIFL